MAKLICENRYVLIGFISIFFVLFGNSQTLKSELLLDSISKLDVTPEHKEYFSIHSRLLDFYKIEENRNGQLVSLVNIGYGYDYLGNIRDANISYEEAYTLCQDTSQLDLGFVIYIYKMKQDIERSKGNQRDALKINKSYIAFEKQYGANDITQGNSYLELAMANRIFGDLESATIYANQALTLHINAHDSLISEELDRSYLIFKDYQILGLIKKDQDEFKAARLLYEKSLNLFKKSSIYQTSESLEDLFSAYSRMIDVLILEGNFELAKKYLEIVSKLINNNPQGIHRYYELKALVEQNEANYQSALSNIDRAISLIPSDDKEYPETPRLKMIKGDILKHTHNLENALIAYQEALNYFDNNVLLRDSNSNPSLDSISEGVQALKIFRRKADVLIESYKKSSDILYLKSAISTYNSSIGLLDKMKLDFVNEGSKYDVVAMGELIYRDAMEAYYLYYETVNDPEAIDGMLTLFEKSKAEILFENISRKFDIITSDVPQEILDKGKLLRAEIDRIKKKLGLSPEEDDALNRQLFSYANELVLHDKYLKDNHPNYFNFKEQVSENITVDHIQNEIDSKTHIITTYEGKGYMYVLYIDKANRYITRIPLAFFDSQLVKYIEFISTVPGDYKGAMADSREAGQYLYKVLFGEIENLQLNDRIVMIPDGKLCQIPIGAIITPGDEYLIESYDILYEYSLKLFIQHEQNLPPENPRILGFAPTFSGLDDEDRICNNQELEELHFAKEEVNSIEELFQGVYFYDDQATATNLKKSFAEYEVIHLSTHGCIHHQNAMLSNVFFADERLSTYDVQNLNARPDLVVLSACNTARGDLMVGEGVIGLSRAFFEAGVKSLQSSLWSINDRSSFLINKNMYANLNKGYTKSMALRKAKINYLKEAKTKQHKHPYYWAAMIQIGSDVPVFTSNDLSAIVYIIGLLILIFVTMAYFKLSNKKINISTL